MAINGTPAMSWGNFLNIPDGTQVLNHGWDQCVALANLYNEGVLGGGFVQTPNAVGWWFNENVASVHGFSRETSNPQVGDIFVASAGLYDSTNGHIGVVTRAWDGSTFGTIEQNGGARYVARYDRGMANMDGFLRPINQSAIAATPAPATSSQGEGIAAEGSDWTYWVPSTQDQATVQAGLAIAGTYSGPIDGNLTSDASVRAIKLVCGNFGFFDLRYLDGQMNKNLCHGILLMAQAHGGYSGRMDWQIDGHVWAAFDGAIRATAPAPVVVPVPVVPPVVVAPVVESEPVKEIPIVEVETPIVEVPIVEVVTPEEVDVPPTAVGVPRVYAPIGDTSAVFANLPTEGTITMKTGLFGAVASTTFWNDLLTRAVNTFIQVSIAGIGVGAVGILDLDYMGIVNLACGGALLSVLQSLSRATTPKA